MVLKRQLSEGGEEGSDRVKRRHLVSKWVNTTYSFVVPLLSLVLCLLLSFLSTGIVQYIQRAESWSDSARICIQLGTHLQKMGMIFLIMRCICFLLLFVLILARGIDEVLICNNNNPISVLGAKESNLNCLIKEVLGGLLVKSCHLHLFCVYLILFYIQL